MSSRDERKKRWLRYNGGQQIEIAENEHKFLLYPYNPKVGVSYTKNRVMLELARPVLENMQKKLGRYCKDKVYQLMSVHCAEANINGSYVGLAANYPGEIFVNFSPFIKGKFYNYELNKQSFEALLDYQALVDVAFPKNHYKVDFETVCEDIIAGLHNIRDVAIIDMDLMTNRFGKEDRGKSFLKLAEGIAKCANNKAVFGIWQTVGRNKGWTDKEFNSYVRPGIRKALSKYFKISRYDIVDYWEGYPMRVDIYTLERKPTCKKESLKAA